MRTTPEDKPESGARRRDGLMLAAGLLMAAGAGLLGWRSVPAFAEVFRSFGAELPPATGLALRYYPALLALPLLVLALWRSWPRPSQRGRVALIGGAALLLLVPLLLAALMYLPILHLG